MLPQGIRCSNRGGQKGRTKHIFVVYLCKSFIPGPFKKERFHHRFALALCPKKGGVYIGHKGVPKPEIVPCNIQYITSETPRFVGTGIIGGVTAKIGGKSGKTEPSCIKLGRGVLLKTTGIAAYQGHTGDAQT